ncbi:site-specific integrase [Sphingomonas sp.]|jgi:integrase|uniref:tyrosine-type recombinase/integrase n=1 Tax=Sphingomonas sp. TaxID=28214 RepID=UPI002636E946|nr:site-specific integrase [Sphingomonas sp.]MDF2493263.1 integrase family protein [Sphingomonas sp.]
MASARITKTAVESIQPGKSDVFVWDAGDRSIKGFGVKVTPSGSRIYVFQYRLGGRGSKTSRFTIGKHGVWTADRARAEAERLARLVGQGGDPSADKKERRRQAVDLAFDAYARDRFLAGYAKTEWARSYGLAERSLRLHAIPALGSTPLPKIKKADISALFDRLPATNAGTRRNTFTVLRRLFRVAVSRGDIERSPMEGYEPPRAPASRDRVLTDDELVTIWKAAGTLGYPFGPYFQILLLTGQRREEVAGLEWSELQRDAALWTLPAARAKNDVAHLVHLTDAVVEILDSMPGVTRAAGKVKWPRKGLVFTTNGKTSVSGYSKAKARLERAIDDVLKEEAGAGGDPPPFAAWRVHDLRRTLATGLQRLGVRFEVTEAVLNHVSGAKSGVAGVYQRHDWRDEKRAALEAWGRHVAQLLEPAAASNVVPINLAAR